MQSISRRGQVALAGLLGGLIGALVFAAASSPAASSPVAPSNTSQTAQVESRIPRDVLAAKQGTEEDYYPSRVLVSIQNAPAGTDAGTARSNAGPLDSTAALRAKQRAEEQYYPSQILLPAQNAPDGSAQPFDLGKALRAQQQVEREYYPGH